MPEKIIIYRDGMHRYQTNPDFVLRRISGEAVLVPTGQSAFGNSMISVNETFCFLWELFSTPTSIPDALEKTKDEYDDPVGEMETQILGFIADCVKYGMIYEAE